MGKQGHLKTVKSFRISIDLGVATVPTNHTQQEIVTQHSRQRSRQRIESLANPRLRYYASQRLQISAHKRLTRKGSGSAVAQGWNAVKKRAVRLNVHSTHLQPTETASSSATTEQCQTTQVQNGAFCTDLVTVSPFSCLGRFSLDFWYKALTGRRKKKSQTTHGGLLI